MEFKACRSSPGEGEEGEVDDLMEAICAGGTMGDVDHRKHGWRGDQAAIALLESGRVDDGRGEKTERPSKQRKCQCKEENAGQVAEEILEEKGHAGAARDSALLRIAQRVASLLLISCTLGQDTVFNDLLLGGRMTGHIFFFFVKKFFFSNKKHTIKYRNCSFFSVCSIRKRKTKKNDLKRQR